MHQRKLMGYRAYFVYFSVFAASMLSFSAGVSYNWAATIEPHLESNDTSINPLPQLPTTLESSWIVSIVALGSIIGPIIGGAIIAQFGKKKTILLLGLPVSVSHLLIAFATRVWMFLIARLLMGISLGGTFAVMSSYIGDIAEDKNRGMLVSFSMAILSIGGLSVYVIGPYISIKFFSFLSLIPLILLFTLFGLFVPETPYDLVQRNRIDEAKRSLAIYRGKHISEIDVEFTNLLNCAKRIVGDKNKVNTAAQIKTLFNTRPLLKGVKIVGVVFIFEGLSGMGVVAAYYQTIFEESGGSLQSTYSVMIIGIVTLFSTLLTSQLVERLGRKLLLLTGFCFMGLSLFSLSTYFLLKSEGHNTDSISWLPLVSLIVFTIAYNIQGSIPWVLLTDIFPSEVLDLCATTASIFTFILGFVLTFVFPYLKQAIGNYGTFYMYGSCMICAMVFTFVCIPETKGKSVEEVQILLIK